MPVHRVHMDDLEREVEDLEKANRIVTMVALQGGVAFAVVYEPKTRRAPGAKETR